MRDDLAPSCSHSSCSPLNLKHKKIRESIHGDQRQSNRSYRRKIRVKKIITEIIHEVFLEWKNNNEKLPHLGISESRGQREDSNQFQKQSTVKVLRFRMASPELLEKEAKTSEHPAWNLLWARFLRAHCGCVWGSVPSKRGNWYGKGDLTRRDRQPGSGEEGSGSERQKKPSHK